MNKRQTTQLQTARLAAQTTCYQAIEQIATRLQRCAEDLRPADLALLAPLGRTILDLASAAGELAAHTMPEEDA